MRIRYTVVMQVFSGLLIMALCVTFLVIGFVTGRLPNSVIEPERATQPWGFWALATVYAFGALVGLMIVCENL